MSINLKNYLVLSRIKNWRGYFLITSFGFVAAEGFLFPFKDIVIFYLIVLLFLGFGFATNDCFDTKEDRLDKERKNPVALKKISFRRGLIFSVFLALLGLGLSTLFGLRVFLFLFFGIMLVFFYSSPPLRLKSRPLFDLLSHGLFGGVLLFFAPLLIFNKELTLLHYWIAFSFFWFSIMLELRNHIEDYEVDKTAGLNTTVGALGLESSENILEYLAVFYPLTLFPIFFFGYQQHFLLFSIFTLIFLLFLFKKEYEIVKNYKIMDIYANLSFVILAMSMIR